MKIAFLSFYQYLLERGAEIWLNQLVANFKKKAEVKIFYPKKVKLKKLDYSDSFSRRLFLDPVSLAILSFTLKIFPELKKYDILVPLNGGWEVLITKIASLFYKKKMVIIGQAGLGFDEKWNLFWQPDLYIALTKAQALWARRFFSKKIEIINNGVDINLFKPYGEKIKLKLKRPILLCAAALQKRQHFKKLIQAVSQIQASLIFAGNFEKQQKKEIENLCRLYLPKRFLIKKFSYKQMPALYRSVDLFVYPNPSWESFGNVFLEAMASNLPVIANNDAIRREIIGKGGFLVNSENIKLILKKIKKALSYNWYNQPRRQAEKFSWDIVTQRYYQVFKNILKKKKNESFSNSYSL